MKNQIERLKTIASAFVTAYLNNKDKNGGISYAEVSGACPCKFTEIQDLVKKCDNQDLTLRTFQRDIIDLRKHFGLTITSSRCRDGVYVLRMDKAGIEMIENRKISIKL